MERRYYSFHPGEFDMEKHIFQKARNWRVRTYSVNIDTNCNHKTYNRKVECITAKVIEKRVQNKPSNTRRMKGPLAIIRLNAQYGKMAG